MGTLDLVSTMLDRSDWRPHNGVYQVWPQSNPIIARHAHFYTLDMDTVASELHHTYGLIPVGRKHNFHYFARADYFRGADSHL